MQYSLGMATVKENKSLALPTIHENGTSARDLMAGALKACEAVGKAQAALCDAAPNNRDYYPQSSGTFYRAQDEHYDRLKRLESVREELVAITDHIADHISERQ